MSYDAILAVDGNPKATYRVTLANALASLPSLGIPLTDGSMNAVAVLLTVETQNARVQFGNSNSSSLGHVIASGSSAMFRGNPAISSMKMGNSAAGSNAVVEVTVFF